MCVYVYVHVNDVGYVDAEVTVDVYVDVNMDVDGNVDTDVDVGGCSDGGGYGCV